MEWLMDMPIPAIYLTAVCAMLGALYFGCRQEAKRTLRARVQARVDAIANSGQETELDQRRKFNPKYNPGFDEAARQKTARLVGIKL